MGTAESATTMPNGQNSLSRSRVTKTSWVIFMKRNSSPKAAVTSESANAVASQMLLLRNTSSP